MSSYSKSGSPDNARKFRKYASGRFAGMLWKWFAVWKRVRAHVRKDTFHKYAVVLSRAAGIHRSSRDIN
jgi:hypothetical protein